MSDRPIIFSSPMMRALLEGRKTQTRRVIVEQPEDFLPVGGAEFVHDRWCWLNGFDGSIIHPFKVAYAPGDRLWVKEAWRTTDSLDHLSPSQIAAAAVEAGYRGPWCPYLTEADQVAHNWGDEDRGVPMFGAWSEDAGRYRHARFMPRWASRLTLTVTDVRVQRLQEISEGDAKAEGIEDGGCLECGGSSLASEGCCYKPTPSFRDSFAYLWNSLHGPDAWDANLWVAAISFTVEQRNIDA